MGNDLVPAGDGLAELKAFIAASQARATQVAYAADWKDFERWCSSHSRAALPADPLTVAAYLAALATAGRKLATVKRRSAAIAHFHRKAQLDNPTAHAGVKAALSGIARERGSAPTKKAALTADLVASAVRKFPADVPGLRDRALILVGFAGALRRSELVALNVSDIERHAKGIVLHLRRSKTDQAGAGRTKAIPYGKRLHVIEALDAWLITARIVEGPIFRALNGQTVLPRAIRPREVANIVKRRFASLGLDTKTLGGHSLRSGFITSAADHGASLAGIANHAGHAKLDTTRGYMQVADAFKDHSGKGFL